MELDKVKGWLQLARPPINTRKHEKKEFEEAVKLAIEATEKQVHKELSYNKKLNLVAGIIGCMYNCDKTSKDSLCGMPSCENCEYYWPIEYRIEALEYVLDLLQKVKEEKIC